LQPIVLLDVYMYVGSSVLLDVPSVLLEVPSVLLEVPSVLLDVPSVLLDVPSVLLDVPSASRRNSGLGLLPMVVPSL
jgi:hypothetical protein